jgi:hypothetical protein
MQRCVALHILKAAVNAWKVGEELQRRTDSVEGRGFESRRRSFFKRIFAPTENLWNKEIFGAYAMVAPGSNGA